jgi:hypothetical protein
MRNKPALSRSELPWRRHHRTLTASSLAIVLRETDRTIVEDDDLKSRHIVVDSPEPIDIRHDQFGPSWIRTCTLTEAHSRPGRATATASQLGGRSAPTASSSCSRGSAAMPRDR